MADHLKGKKLNPVQAKSFTHLLSRYGLGYTVNFPPKPFDTIEWIEEEQTALHPWSLEKRLYDYGYYQLDKIFGTPQQYLDTRPDIVDLIKIQVNKGAMDRLKDDKAKGDPEDELKSQYEDLMKKIPFK